MNEVKNENYIMLNGKRVDLTDEQIEKLGLKVEKKDLFKRVEKGDTYYFIENSGTILNDFDSHGFPVEKRRYDVANYCTDRSLLQQRAYHETLSRLLWRFSMQNDGDKIDWSNHFQDKYTIFQDSKTGKFSTSLYNYRKTEGCIHFYSYTAAQRAIDEIILPFMKEHPDFVW